MWTNYYLLIGPLRAAFCFQPNRWPWAIFVVWATGFRRARVLIDWERKGVRPDGD